MDLLKQKSLDLLRQHQTAGGAFIACPSFATYRYAWFRDGSYCALALAEYGDGAAADRFLEWGAAVILRYQAKMRRCIERRRQGLPLVAAECLHSRFTLEGFEVPGNWGHNQLDGLGTWLWLYGRLHSTAADLPSRARVDEAAALTAEYLAALWQEPCSDCWEEHEDQRHTYTLASIWAGLSQFAAVSGDARSRDVAADVREFVLTRCVSSGSLVKSVGSDLVDANLVGLVQPYRLLAWDDPLFQGTLARIEQELCTPGLHRYRGDSYYGAGEWVLLTAWLGWAYAEAGERSKAQAILNWTRAQANDRLELPEQVPHALFVPAGYPEWVERWGEIASPLLWSHAKYLLLLKSIEKAQSEANR